MQRLREFAQLLEEAQGFRMVAAVERDVAEVFGGDCVIARAGQGRERVERFAQELAGGIEPAEMAQRFRRLHQAARDAQWPSGGPGEGEAALVPFERGVKVIQAGEAVADVGGGGDGARHLAAGKRIVVGADEVPDCRAEFARLVGHHAEEVADPRAQALRQGVDDIGEIAGIVIPALFRGAQVAEHGKARQRGFGDLGADHVAGGMCARRGLFEFRIALFGMSVVPVDDGQQQMAVGASGMVGQLRECGECLFRQRARRVEFAIQALRFRADAVQPGKQPRVFEAMAGKMTGCFIGKEQCARRVSLAQMPGEGSQDSRPFEPVQRRQHRLQPRDFFIGSEQLHSLVPRYCFIY